ncbi:MAG: MFS transporter, partial [Herbaspirillum sp.]
VDRYHFSLVQSGNVLLIISVLSLFGPPLAGRLDPGSATRRRWLVGMTLLMSALFAVFIFGHSAALDISAATVISIVSGYMVLQYADVRVAYPASLIGRAMAVFTMSMFLGIALMQWLTGLAASIATAHGHDPYTAVMALIAVLLLLGALAFAWLPGPKLPTGAPA